MSDRTNRILLGPKPPKGFPNQNWFQLLETFRKLNAAVNANGTNVSDIQTEQKTVKPTPLVAYGRGPATGTAAGAVSGISSVGWGAGPIQGYVEVTDAAFPGAKQTATNAARAGNNRTDIFSSMTFTSSSSPTATTGLVHAGLIALPQNFSGWETLAMRAFVAAQVTGLDTGATAKVEWVFSNPAVGGSDITKELGPFSESGGTITIAYGGADAEIVFTAEDMRAADFIAGSAFNFVIRFTLASSAQHTGGFFSVGRIELNWK